MTSLEPLVTGVRLLSLDAGNTIIFLDHARVARLLAGFGFETTAERLIVAEGAAKRRHAAQAMENVEWSGVLRPGARSWGNMIGTMAAEAGFPVAMLPAAIDAAWLEHERLNLWSRVPEGFGDAIERARARGIKIAVVSNSEGMLEPLFHELGIHKHFDMVLDSGVIGIEKPDPRIFRLALEGMGVPAEATLHLGDMFSTDVLGARAVGMRTALVDPFGHYEGEYSDVPRVRDVAQIADAFA